MLNDLCRSPTIVLLLLLPRSHASRRSQFGRITVFQGRIFNDRKDWVLSFVLVVD
jgi:hypothetical protein